MDPLAAFLLVVGVVVVCALLAFLGHQCVEDPRTPAPPHRQCIRVSVFIAAYVAIAFVAMFLFDRVPFHRIRSDGLRTTAVTSSLLLIMFLALLFARECALYVLERLYIPVEGLTTVIHTAPVIVVE